MAGYDEVCDSKKGLAFLTQPPATTLARQRGAESQLIVEGIVTSGFLSIDASNAFSILISNCFLSGVSPQRVSTRVPQVEEPTDTLALDSFFCARELFLQRGSRTTCSRRSINLLPSSTGSPRLQMLPRFATNACGVAL